MESLTAEAYLRTRTDDRGQEGGWNDGSHDEKNMFTKYTVTEVVFVADDTIQREAGVG